MARYEYKGYVIDGHHLITPFDREYDLSLTANYSSGARCSVYWRPLGKTMPIARMAMCIACKMDNLPSGYEVHHVDGNREDSRLENLVTLLKADHEAAHALMRRSATEYIGNAIHGPSREYGAFLEEYLQFIREAAVLRPFEL